MSSFGINKFVLFTVSQLQGIWRPFFNPISPEQLHQNCLKRAIFLFSFSFFKEINRRNFFSSSPIGQLLKIELSRFLLFVPNHLVVVGSLDLEMVLIPNNWPKEFLDFCHKRGHGTFIHTHTCLFPQDGVAAFVFFIEKYT